MDSLDPTARRALGRTGLEVTALSLGTGPLGGLYQPVGDEQAVATVERAWDLGIRFFDTAPLYGFGLAERRLGEALRDKPRDEYVLATKVGRLVRPADRAEADETQSDLWPEADPKLVATFDFSHDGVLRSLDESLERLGLDRVDVVHLHDPDRHYDEALAGAFSALARLRDEGTISAVGAGMNQTEMLTRFAVGAGFDCFLVAGRYTLLDDVAERELLPACLDGGIAVIAGGVFNSGLLADPRPGAPYDYAEAPPELVERAHRLAAACERSSVSLKAAALQFPLRHPAVATVLVGARSPDEIAEDANLFTAPIPAFLWEELRQIT